MQFVQTFSIKYSYLQKHNYIIKQNPLRKRRIGTNIQPPSGREGDHGSGGRSPRNSRFVHSIFRTQLRRFCNVA